MLRETSILAYKNLQDSGKEASNESLVLDAIQQLRFATQDDIADFTGLAREAVHKRISGLFKKGLIAKSPFKKMLVTGEYGLVWMLPNISIELKQSA